MVSMSDYLLCLSCLTRRSTRQEPDPDKLSTSTCSCAHRQQARAYQTGCPDSGLTVAGPIHEVIVMISQPIIPSNLPTHTSPGTAGPRLVHVCPPWTHATSGVQSITFSTPAHSFKALKLRLSLHLCFWSSSSFIAFPCGSPSISPSQHSSTCEHNLFQCRRNH